MKAQEEKDAAMRAAVAAAAADYEAHTAASASQDIQGTKSAAEAYNCKKKKKKKPHVASKVSLVAAALLACFFNIRCFGRQVCYCGGE